MTIKRMAKYLKDKNVPKLGRNKKGDVEPPFLLSTLKGIRVAFETSDFIYKQNWAAVKRVIESFPFIWIEGNGWSVPSDHEVFDMFKILFRSYIKKILATGVIPVFVVEGKSPDLKANTCQKRANIRQENNKKFTTLQRETNFSKFKEQLQYAYPPTLEHIQAVMDILKDMKITTLRAKYEAEGVCAYLVKCTTDPHHCKCAYSSDCDIFMYGCPAVIRNIRPIYKDGCSKGSDLEATAYSLRDILTTLDLLPCDQPITQEMEAKAFEQFNLLCVLSGTDYFENVSKIGQAKILSMIKKYDISTFSEACNINPAFNVIPYHEIQETLMKNQEYNIVYSPYVSDTKEPQITSK